MGVDLLGVNFFNQQGAWRSSSTNLSALARAKKNYLGIEDLSSGFNTYRCISPNDPPPARVAALAAMGRGYLRRQYSLDRSDDPAGSTVSGTASRTLHKQNSAGAAPTAHDLQRIEENPKNLAKVTSPRDLSNVSSESAESLA